MKLDASILRYLEKDEFRVLTAIEMGMKNHEIVPVHLIESIAKLKRGGVFKIIQGLLKKKLITHMNKHVDGYCLAYQGYDILAINVFIKRGLIKSLGNMMGTGKESDIYLCVGPNNEDVVLKLARLGRTSFRAVKSKRDYLKGRSKHNWLYLSRLSAIKEFTFMQSLFEAGLPTPTPISHNRHAILMSLLQAYPLINIVKIQNPGTILNYCINMAVRLAELGLVHCDFNQFNILVSETEEVFVIDFPQMVSVNHFNAEELFHKDLVCLNEFFGGKFGVESEELPTLKEIRVVRNIDLEIKASGYLRENLRDKEIKEMDEILEVAMGNEEQSGEEDDQEVGDDAETGELEEGERKEEEGEEKGEDLEEESGTSEEEVKEEEEEGKQAKAEDVGVGKGEEEAKEESKGKVEDGGVEKNEEEAKDEVEEGDEGDEGDEDSQSDDEEKTQNNSENRKESIKGKEIPTEKKKKVTELDIKDKLKKARRKKNIVKINQNKVKAKSQLNY